MIAHISIYIFRLTALFESAGLLSFYCVRTPWIKAPSRLNSERAFYECTACSLEELVGGVPCVV